MNDSLICDFMDVGLKVDLVTTGITGKKRWIDGGSRADRKGDKIHYIVIGSAEVTTVIENIGVDLSRDVQESGYVDPFSEMH